MFVNFCFCLLSTSFYFFILFGVTLTGVVWMWFVQTSDSICVMVGVGGGECGRHLYQHVLYSNNIPQTQK
jgi:hypothetical protein